jgi:hypothetical protein
MAYSSTVALCSNTTQTISHQSSTTIYITVALITIILISMFFKKRRNNTMMSIALAMPGSMMIMYSVIKNGGEVLYFTGVATLVFSIWYNGSFNHILNNYIINNNIIKKQKV